MAATPLHAEEDTKALTVRSTRCARAGTTQRRGHWACRSSPQAGALVKGCSLVQEGLRCMTARQNAVGLLGVLIQASMAARSHASLGA